MVICAVRCANTTGLDSHPTRCTVTRTTHRAAGALLLAPVATLAAPHCPAYPPVAGGWGVVERPMGREGPMGPDTKRRAM